jgi:outer membrane protein assembly factor BamB
MISYKDLSLVNGQVLWQQSYLRNRVLTTPAASNGAVVVADHEGYVHWLSQANSLTIGRVKVSDKPIIAGPVVIGNRLFVLSTSVK